MGDPKGFMKYAREGPKRKPIELRVLDWKEMYEPITEDKLKAQGARCMDCGVPFCQGIDRLSGREPDSRVERSRLSRPLERCAQGAAYHEQFP